MQTLQHIPVWVFFLLIGLIALGLLQTRTRQIRRQRLLGINIALAVFTLVGVVQQWRHTPWLALGLLTWAATCLLVSWALGQGTAPEGPASTHPPAASPCPAAGCRWPCSWRFLPASLWWAC
jgi:hypothetical protein